MIFSCPSSHSPPISAVAIPFSCVLDVFPPLLSLLLCLHPFLPSGLPIPSCFSPIFLLGCIESQPLSFKHIVWTYIHSTLIHCKKLWKKYLYYSGCNSRRNCMPLGPFPNILLHRTHTGKISCYVGTGCNCLAFSWRWTSSCNSLS